MKAIVTAMIFVLVALASVACTSAELCPPTDQKREWSSSCFEGPETARHVKPANVKKIVANKAGYASIMIGDLHELVAVDSTGAVRIPHIFHTGDFDFPNASEGLGRFQIISNNGKGETINKCGYFDGLTFKITIPATYDQCLPFDQGAATVCKKCTSICTEPDCQNTILVGGKGFSIDRQNRILREFAPPALDRACDGGPGKVVKITEATSYLQCNASANSPFGQLR